MKLVPADNVRQSSRTEGAIACGTRTEPRFLGQIAKHHYICARKSQSTIHITTCILRSWRVPTFFLHLIRR